MSREGSGAEPTSGAPSPPRKKKKKKKRDPAAPTEAAPARDATSAPTPGVIATFFRGASSADDHAAEFTRDFPADPELARLVEAFHRGNYALVRERAPELARVAVAEDVRRAARELRRRVDPDPIAVTMLVAAVALLAFLSFWYWSHPHAPR